MRRHQARLHPRFPERICWGCDKFCPADDLACGNGTIRTPHPQELFGNDWLAWCDGFVDTSGGGSRNGRERSALRHVSVAADSGIEGDDIPEQQRIEDEEHS